MKLRIWLVLLGVPFLFFLTGLLTIKDYGISWDEPIHFYRGQALLHYFLTGEKNFDPIPEVRNHLPKFLDDSAFGGRKILEKNEIRRSYYQNNGLSAEFFIKEDVGHPPLNDILAALTNYIFYQKLGVMGDIEAHHFFNIISSTILVAVVTIFAYQKYGPLSAVAAGVTMSLYPLFFSESHFNIKDPPQAAFFTLTIWAFWMSLKKFNWKWLLLSVVSFGVSLGMKFNIIFLPFILVPYLIISFKDIFKKGVRIPKNYLIVLFLSPIIIIGLLFLPWVYLWQNPVGNFLKIIGYYKDIGTGSLGEPFFRVKNFNLYPIIWIFTTTHPLVLLLFLIGIIVAILKIRVKDKTELLWLFWFLLPVARVTLPGTNIYGGVRQIMEFLPAMILLSAAGFNFIYGLIKKFMPNYHKLLGAGLLLFLIIPQIFIIVKYHPNQNVYFNSLIGGLSGAKEKNIPYWGNSFGNVYYQLIKWVNSNVEQGAKLALVQGTGLNVPRIWLREDIDYSNGYWSGIERKGEYLMELNYNNPIKAYPYSIEYTDNFLVPVYEIKVDGVVIGKVWKNDYEHTKLEFRNEKRLNNLALSKNKEEKSLSFRLGRKAVLSRMIINFVDSANCIEPKGYVKTSTNGKEWTLEAELVPSVQVGNIKMVESNRLTYFFAGVEANTVKIVMDDDKSCLFNRPALELYTF